MPQSFVLALVGLGGTIGGALIAMLAGMANNYYNFKLNEATRQLDLYKMAYPQLIEAAKTVAGETRLLAMNITYFINCQKGLDAKVRDAELLNLRTQIPKVILLTASYEWLLKDETNKAVSDFHLECDRIMNNWAEVDKKQLEALHLVQAGVVVGLRRQLHMNIIHNLSFDENYTRQRLWRHNGYNPKRKKKTLPRRVAIPSVVHTGEQEKQSVGLRSE